MAMRDLRTEFDTLRRLLVGVQRADDNGPVLTIEEVELVSETAQLIAGRVHLIDERAPGRPVRTSDFDYESAELGTGGPEDAADLLLVNLEEELLAAEDR